MIKIHYITYATHKFGLFEELINNKYNINIKVLGFGKKWNSFVDKFIGVLEYINNLNDNDIVVFIDGFDSLINKNLDNFYNEFLKMDTKVLVSKDIGGIFNDYLNYNKFVFGTCYNNIVANTGLYCGYIKYIKILLNDLIKFRCNNDQVNFNTLCSKYDFIKIDVNNIIFHNIINRNIKSDALIVSYPASISINRLYRMYFDMFQYFHIFLSILYLILIYYGLNSKRYILTICIILLLYISYKKGNFTCIKKN